MSLNDTSAVKDSKRKCLFVNVYILMHKSVFIRRQCWNYRQTRNSVRKCNKMWSKLKQVRSFKAFEKKSLFVMHSKVFHLKVKTFKSFVENKSEPSHIIFLPRFQSKYFLYIWISFLYLSETQSLENVTFHWDWKIRRKRFSNLVWFLRWSSV